MSTTAGDFDAGYFSAAVETRLARLAIDSEVFLEASHLSSKVKIVGIGSAAIFNPFFEDFFNGRV